MSTRIEGIVDRLSDAEHYSDIEWILDAPMVNFCNSVVDSKIQANVEAQGRAGIPAKLVRRVIGKCCPWCEALAGEYNYPDVPKDVYKRHENCNCVVEYYPGDGRKQDVWNKQWYEFDADTYKEMKEIGIDTNIKAAAKSRIKQAKAVVSASAPSPGKRIADAKAAVQAAEYINLAIWVRAGGYMGDTSAYDGLNLLDYLDQKNIKDPNIREAVKMWKQVWG